MNQIRLLDQIREMARRSYIRGAGRDSHNFPRDSDAEFVFQLEWDQCAAADIKLRAIRSMPMRARPVSEVQA